LRTLTGVLLAGSLILTLVVAGCGGGGDESIDKASFAEQANGICEKVSGTMAAKLKSISQRESTKPGYDYTKTQIVVVEKALVPGLEEELAKIRALGIPTDAAKEAKALLQAYESAVVQTKAKPEALVKGAIPYEGAELAATRLGASECPVAPVNSGSSG
jgi:hypothetical protein